MAFNMYSPSNFNMGGMGGPGPQGMGQGQQNPPTPQQEFQFYSALFNVLDTDKKQALNGGQVFNFFLSSKLTKNTLADIWDAVKQNGVLVVTSFVSAMKLITLAQKGIKPELANLNNFQYVGPPQLQYPPNTTLIAPIGLLIQGQGGGQGQQPNHAKQPSAADPFSSLGLGLGGGGSKPPQSKPAGPSWTSDEMGANGAVSAGKNTATSSPNLTGMSGPGQPFPASMSIAAQPNGGVAAASSGSLPGMGVGNGVMPGGVGAPGAVGVGGVGNQYGPSAMMKQAHVRNSTRTLQHDVADYASGDETSGALPSLGRAMSRRLLEDERSREELRAANQREKMARQQLNEARISNEKLERENEQLRLEIKEARDAQANALKQSGEALQAIQPMRVENEKLKEAIREWQELIQTKDTELEQLENELAELRLESDQNKKEAREAIDDLDNLKYKVDSITSKLEESEQENKRHYREISQLKDEKLKIESEKRDLDIEIVKMQSQIKTLERQAKHAASQQESKRRESDLFNNFGGGFGSSGPDSNRGRARRSTTGSRSRSPMQKAAASVSGPPVDQMLGSSDLGGLGTGTGTNSSDINIAPTKPSKSEDLFAGLSHSPPIVEETKPAAVNSAPADDFDFGGSGDTTFPEFNENNPPPPTGLSADDRINIGDVAVPPDSVVKAMHGQSEDDSEFDEIEVEDTIMEEYEVEEIQTVTVPKLITVTELSDIEIPVQPGDVTDGVYSGQETFGSSDWFLSLKLFNSNKKHFVNSDQDKDGKLNVKEAWAFFQMAKMDAKVLQQAWKLVATMHNDVDLPKDGLSEIQFHCMFGIIITMKKKGMKDCPNEVPDALQFDEIRKLGQPVVGGKVTIRKTTQVQRNEPTQEQRTVKVKKTRPVTKKVKKKVAKKGGKKGKKSKKSKKKEPAALDDFGDFGNDAPGASASQAKSGGGGFDDFGDFGDFGNDSAPAKAPAKKKKENKKSEFLDDFGDEQPGSTQGATPGGDTWEDWGNTDW